MELGFSFILHRCQPIHVNMDCVLYESMHVQWSPMCFFFPRYHVFLYHGRPDLLSWLCVGGTRCTQPMWPLLQCPFNLPLNPCPSIFPRSIFFLPLSPHPAVLSPHPSLHLPRPCFWLLPLPEYYDLPDTAHYEARAPSKVWGGHFIERAHPMQCWAIQPWWMIWGKWRCSVSSRSSPNVVPSPALASCMRQAAALRLDRGSIQGEKMWPVSGEEGKGKPCSAWEGGEEARGRGKEAQPGRVERGG